MQMGTKASINPTQQGTRPCALIRAKVTNIAFQSPNNSKQQINLYIPSLLLQREKNYNMRCFSKVEPMKPFLVLRME